MGDGIASFGKHRGRTFQDVYDNEHEYAIWAVNVQYPSGLLRPFVDYCLARGLQPNADAGRDTVQRFALAAKRQGITEFQIYASSGRVVPRFGAS
jgi:uncharacterized protein (DUF3820 family)